MQIATGTSTASQADEQRKQVQAALDPRRMSRYFDGLFPPSGMRRAHAGVCCHILDVKYEAGDYCTVLYRYADQLLIGTLRWGKDAGDIPLSAQVIEPLGMRVYRFEQDPALPGLATVLDGKALGQRLAAELPALQQPAIRVLRCQVAPLRYRPGKRCTVRVVIAIRDESTRAIRTETLFGKVYHDTAKAAAVFDEMQMLADSEPARTGRMVVARPAAYVPDLRLVLQAPVSGTPLELLLSGFAGATSTGDPRAWSGVVRAAPALAALHTAGLRTERERPITAEIQRFSLRAVKASAVAPELGGRLTELVRALQPGLERLDDWGAEISVVHGDCKPSQFMIDTAGVAILDFDHCGMADPATDVGTFAATLRQLGLWQALNADDAPAAARRTAWLGALEQQFINEYCAASNRDDAFRTRLIWYEAVALMRKALRSFARSPRSAMTGVLVDEAWRCLATLEPWSQRVISGTPRSTIPHEKSNVP